ncbi:MAG TPA: ATP-binding protein [Jatrophihabitantaceae bacterium]
MGAMLVRHEPTSASTVRHALAHDLDEHGVDEDSVATVVLVASELVTNAIRHGDIADADDELDVDWAIHTDHVVVSVEDPSSKLPQRRHPMPEEPGGRGLTIIDALSSAWGAEPTRRGKRVWAKVSIAR